MTLTPRRFPGLLVSGALLWTLSTAVSAATLSVGVSDGSGDELTNALVLVGGRGFRRAGRTGILGDVSFLDVPQGLYTITVSKAGLWEKSRTVRVDREEGTVRVSFLLDN